MTDTSALLEKWTAATANLKWGVQRAFYDVLTLAKDGKINLVYGADYSGDGGACLVNQAGAMLVTKGGHGIPMGHYGDVVSLFDSINRSLETKKINWTPGKVDPLAAETLLRYFAPLKEAPSAEDTALDDAYATTIIPEVSDEEMQEAVMELLNQPPTVIESEIRKNSETARTDS